MSDDDPTRTIDVDALKAAAERKGASDTRIDIAAPASSLGRTDEVQSLTRPNMATPEPRRGLGAIEDVGDLEIAGEVEVEFGTTDDGEPPSRLPPSSSRGEMLSNDLRRASDD